MTEDESVARMRRWAQQQGIDAALARMTAPKPPVCGGCAGLGSHRRWCEAAVGRAASILGRQAEQAEALGDQVGPNEMAAANHLWAAASLLRKAAAEAKIRHMERVTEETRRLENLDFRTEGL